MVQGQGSEDRPPLDLANLSGGYKGRLSHILRSHQEWVREEQIETRKEGAAHAWNWEVGGECSVLAARRTALLKGPEG